MKKVFLATMIFSLIFAFSGVASAQELEKISGPEHIKEFRVMKKIGNALFGIRLDREASGVTPGLGYNASSTEPKLEKISHPSQLSLFDKIKRIGTALWGIRKRVENKSVMVKPVAVQCVKDAIDKKDTSLKTAISAHGQATLTAIDARGICQKLALDKTTGSEQLESNKACIKTFQESMKTSDSALKTSREAAWKTYNTDLKACSALQRAANATSTDPESNGEIVVDDGGDSGETNQ